MHITEKGIEIDNYSEVVEILKTKYLKAKQKTTLTAVVSEANSAYNQKALAYFWAVVAEKLFLVMKKNGENFFDKHAAVDYVKSIVGFTTTTIDDMTGEVIERKIKSLSASESGREDLNWLTNRIIQIINENYEDDVNDATY